MTDYDLIPQWREPDHLICDPIGSPRLTFTGEHDASFHRLGLLPPGTTTAACDSCGCPVWLLPTRSVVRVWRRGSLRLARRYKYHYRKFRRRVVPVCRGCGLGAKATVV